MAKSIWVLMVASFLGSAFFKVEIGSFHITLFKVALFLCLILAALDVIKNPKYKKGKEHQFFIVFIGVWAVENIASLIWVKDYVAWAKYTYYIFIFIFFFYIFQRFLKTEETYFKSYLIILSTIAGLHFLGWIEVVAGKLLFSGIDKAVAEAAIQDRNPVTVMGNPNDFGLVMMFGFFFTFFLKRANDTHKLACMLLQASFALLTFLTGSRSALLGLVSGLFGIGLLMFFHEPKKRKYLLLTGSIAILAAGMLLTSKGMVFDFTGKTMNSESMRVNLIRNGLHFLMETYGAGVGGGNFEYWVQNYPAYDTGTAVNMHNWWAEVLVCYGVAVFFLYCIFYIRVFCFFYRKYCVCPDKRLQRGYLGILGFIMGFVIGSIGASSLFSNIYVWCIWALVASHSLFLRRSRLCQGRLQKV